MDTHFGFRELYIAVRRNFGKGFECHQVQFVRVLSYGTHWLLNISLGFMRFTGKTLILFRRRGHRRIHGHFHICPKPLAWELVCQAPTRPVTLKTTIPNFVITWLSKSSTCSGRRWKCFVVSLLSLSESLTFMIVYKFTLTLIHWDFHVGNMLW